MSRRDWSATNFLRLASGLVTAVPLTLACWARTSVSLPADNQDMIGLYTSGSAANRNAFVLTLNSGSDTVRAVTADGSGTNGADATVAVATNVWFHACAVFSTTANSAVYFNGGSKGTTGSGKTPSGIDRTSIGLGDGSSAIRAFAPSGTGDIAEVSIWNIDLSDSDVALLATGVSPYRVRRANLVGYWLGNTDIANAIDRNKNMAIQGTLTQLPHALVRNQMPRHARVAA